MNPAPFKNVICLRMTAYEPSSFPCDSRCPSQPCSWVLLLLGNPVCKCVMTSIFSLKTKFLLLCIVFKAPPTKSEFPLLCLCGLWKPQDTGWCDGLSCPTLYDWILDKRQHLSHFSLTAQAKAPTPDVLFTIVPESQPDSSFPFSTLFGFKALSLQLFPLEPKAEGQRWRRESLVFTIFSTVPNGLPISDRHTSPVSSCCEQPSSCCPWTRCNNWEVS